MNKNYRIEKLDGRFNFHQLYSHRIWVCGPHRQNSYYKLYQWCNQQFGFGIDVRIIWSVYPDCQRSQTHPIWAFWINDGGDCFVYLRDEALTAFLMQQDNLNKLFD